MFSDHGLAAWGRGVAFDEALARALAAGPALAAVTLGAAGVHWIGAGGTRSEACAPRVNARDSTGAGDMFHAALALALSEGRDDAFAWACAAAA